MEGGFCGSLFSISDFTRGNHFSRISCTVFESSKKRKPFGRSRYTVCTEPISLKFSNVKKARNKLGIFVGGSLLSRDLIITDQ